MVKTEIQYKTNNWSKWIGIILIVLAIIFLLMIGLYQSNVDENPSCACLTSYDNPSLDIATELFIFFFVLIGGYLLFTVYQLGNDAEKIKYLGPKEIDFKSQKKAIETITGNEVEEISKK